MQLTRRWYVLIDQIIVILFQVLNVNQRFLKQSWRIWTETTLFMHCPFSTFSSYRDAQFSLWKIGMLLYSYNWNYEAPSTVWLLFAAMLLRKMFFFSNNHSDKNVNITLLSMTFVIIFGPIFSRTSWVKPNNKKWICIAKLNFSKSLHKFLIWTENLIFRQNFCLVKINFFMNSNTNDLNKRNGWCRWTSAKPGGR